MANLLPGLYGLLNILVCDNLIGNEVIFSFRSVIIFIAFYF